MLLAEDNEENVKVARALIGRLGHELTVARDGAGPMETVSPSETKSLIRSLIRSLSMGEYDEEGVRKLMGNPPDSADEGRLGALKGRLEDFDFDAAVRILEEMEREAAAPEKGDAP